MTESVTAAAFVRARRAGESLAHYPGRPPRDQAEAYGVQDEAINLWAAPIGGWKVGRINAPWDAEMGGDRLVGPIFQPQIRSAEAAEMPVFEGGFAAVEGEFVFVVREDAPSDKVEWSRGEAMGMVGGVRLGIEVASSPYANINNEGPLVTISDFGNNAGLLIGAELIEWHNFSFLNTRVETRLDSKSVGEGWASTMPGGPLESFRAALSICASRGRPLKRGMLISTGAVSGVHEARSGQDAQVIFEGLGNLSCRLVGMRQPVRATTVAN
jgi:2-keto-4-pentenoate hydratase